MSDRWMLVCVLLVAAGIAVGWLLGHWRAYAECCDCCTCQTCTEGERDEGSSRWADDLRSDTLADLPPVTSPHSQDFGGRDRSDWPAVRVLDASERRHTILLEPGPTIYPALAELAGEVMDRPESHPDASDSTFVRKLLIEWEQRYPIPVGAP